MSGTLKVGGVNLATHTGTDGTGNPVLDTAVFPAGHIVNFASGVYQGSDLSSNHTTWQEPSSSLRCALTPTSPNKIFLYFCSGIPSVGGGGAMYGSWGIVDPSDGSFASQTAGEVGANISTHAGGLEEWNWYDAGSNVHAGTHSAGMLYTPASYGSLITFTPTWKNSTTDTHHFTEGGSNQQIFSFAFEIQQ